MVGAQWNSLGYISAVSEDIALKISMKQFFKVDLP